MNEEFVDGLPEWPPGTHRFRNLPEMLVAIAASDEARHLAEVKWVQDLPRERRRAFLLGAQKKRTPEAYARLRDALLEARAAKVEQLQEQDVSQGILI